MQDERKEKALRIPELIAIALGGMVGGGIFTVLGISVGMIGAYTPFAIALGGLLAALAAYSYVKLGAYYKDEGATYAFIKRIYPSNPFAASVIGWWVVFGYISTIALYAVTFASYFLAVFDIQDAIGRKLVAGCIIALFTLVNVWSVKGMGEIEDLLVYSKLIILAVISVVLIHHGPYHFPELIQQSGNIQNHFFSIAVVAALTFVAYEGFQLVIHATEDMDEPERKIPISIFSAVAIAALIYMVLSYGALTSIPMQSIIEKQEYALAAGAGEVLGKLGNNLVILGALLATTSAISGTLFGASRLMASIASDGYLPTFLGKRHKGIPRQSIIVMSLLSFSLIVSGNLVLILEFGSITFLLVCLLVSIANFKVRKITNSSATICLLSIASLFAACLLIIYYQYEHHIHQLYAILVIYALLTLSAFFYSSKKKILGIRS